MVQKVIIIILADASMQIISNDFMLGLPLIKT